MLKGYQKKYLKGLVHSAKPVVFVGQKGITKEVAKTIDECLNTHEVIKIKFIGLKEKSDKKTLCTEIGDLTTAEMVGMIGHIVTFYRRQKDSEKRKVQLPSR